MTEVPGFYSWLAFRTLHQLHPAADLLIVEEGSQWNDHDSHEGGFDICRPFYQRLCVCVRSCVRVFVTPMPFTQIGSSLEFPFPFPLSDSLASAVCPRRPRRPLFRQRLRQRQGPRQHGTVGPSPTNPAPRGSREGLLYLLFCGH